MRNCQGKGSKVSKLREKSNQFYLFKKICIKHCNVEDILHDFMQSSDKRTILSIMLLSWVLLSAKKFMPGF